MTYPGTYLKTKPFEIRYKIVAEQLGDTSDKIIVDLNCGEPLFKNYIKYKEYYANDVFMPDDVSGITFSQTTDDKVDKKADILCLFGHSGGLHTGHPMESKTISDTVVRLAGYEPEYIVLEMAQKWENDFGIMSDLKNRLKGYKEIFEQKINIEPVSHYHDQRQISILKRVI